MTGVSEAGAKVPLRRIASLSGPRGVPLLGNALQMAPARIHRDVEQWARQFGPLFRFRLGRQDVLVLADHELVGRALRERPDVFGRSPATRVLGLEMGLPPGLFGSEGDTWRRYRRIVMTSFAPDHVRSYFPALVRVAQRLQGRWLEPARSGRPIELLPELMRFTVDAIAGLALGADINTLEAGEDVIQQHLDKVLPAIFRRALTLIPYWRWFKLPSDRALDRSVAIINATITGFIAQARARLRANPELREQPGNLLEAMLAAAEQEGSAVTDRDVAGNVLTMLLAGEDTTANTLAWMIYLLHRHPAALQRAQAEVRGLAGDAAALTPERLDQLVFLEACAHETMRLKPVAPFLLLQALRDTQIADVHVPRGTLVWTVLRHDSVNEAHFRNASSFEPQRWLADETGAAANASGKRVAMPFGAGPRICPGRYLALLEIKLCMAALLGRFDIEVVETPDGGEAQEHLYFAMAPLGLRMRLRECRVDRTAA